MSTPSAQVPRLHSGHCALPPGDGGRSLRHDGSGPEPGLKDDDGELGPSPAPGRITQRRPSDTLRTWHALLEEPSTPVTPNSHGVRRQPRNRGRAAQTLSRAPRLGRCGSRSSRADGTRASTARRASSTVEWGPVDRGIDAILQGPHIFVGNPFYKSPNPTMLHNQDWSPVDLESSATRRDPGHVVQAREAAGRVRRRATRTGATNAIPARDYYRIAWRNMAANTGERTLIPAIHPAWRRPYRWPVRSLGVPAKRRRADLATAAAMSPLLSRLSRPRHTEERHFAATCRVDLPSWSNGSPLDRDRPAYSPA